MSGDWDDDAKNWDANTEVRLYAAQAFASLSAYLNLQDAVWKERKVLDFGCGTGLLSEKLSPHVGEIYAVDTSKKMIEVLGRKNLPNVTAVVADIGDLEVAAAATWFAGFDLIVASSVCSFLSDYEAAVGILSRTLLPHGYFAQWDWQSSGGENFGLTKDRIRGALEAGDLKNVDVEIVFSMESETEALPVLMGIGSR